LKKDKKGWQPKALWHGAIAAMFFAISFVLTKYIYTQTNFISGLIWTRIGAGIAALAFFAMPETRRGIALAPHKTGHQKKVVFYCLAACGALAGFLQNYAISLGSVVIVNALQGLQYVFLLIMGVILSMNYPNIIKEDVRGKILVQKIAAIILITAGLVFLKI
jgi:drug/metabolite transporter (DMT)-like permease